MFPVLLLPIAFLLHPGDCRTLSNWSGVIIACSDFRSIRLVSSEDSNITVANESTIGALGHWQGVVPRHYAISLNFSNQTHYEGSANITFDLILPTDRIYISQGAKNPWIDYSSVTIVKPRGHSGTADGQICLSDMTFLESDGVLIVNLNATLAANLTYVVSFPRFRGKAYDRRDSSGGFGLSLYRPPETYDLLPASNATALTTSFQMRYARTVLPCFDHPTLKARFDLCLEYPSELLAAANTAVNRSESIGPGRTRDCFETTPRMSTYLLAFSLMKGYSSSTIRTPDRALTIEVYCPTNLTDSRRWYFNDTIASIRYMERASKFKYPLDRLGIILAAPPEFVAIENFGLVTLQLKMHPRSRGASFILNHEIVHQWIGNVVTLENWREICLQEGLTTIFEWIMSDHFDRFPMDNRKDLAEVHRNPDRYPAYASMDYENVPRVSQHCYEIPSLFFYTIAKSPNGRAILERMLQRVIEERSFGTAGIDVWDRVLGEVTNGSLRGYIKGRFQHGPLFLYTSKISNSDCVLIRQRQIDPNDPAAFRPIPLSITAYNGTTYNIFSTLLNESESRVCGLGDAFAVDPENHVFARKLYSPGLYRSFLKADKENRTMRGLRLSDLFDNFCTALETDLLPVDDELSTEEASEWMQLFEALLKARHENRIYIRDACHTCMRSEEAIRSRDVEERKIWNQRCNHTRLIWMLGHQAISSTTAAGVSASARPMSTVSKHDSWISSHSNMASSNPFGIVLLGLLQNIVNMF